MRDALSVQPTIAVRPWIVMFVAVSMVFLASPPAKATHVQCGDVLTADTTLDSNLHCSGRALNIGESGITVDLGGHTITGIASAERGINNSGGYDDVTIRNGTITGFPVAVHFNGVSDSLLEGLSLESNERWGIFMQFSSSNTVRDNVVTNTGGVSGVGIALNNSHYNEITHNSLTNSTFAGVELFNASSNNTISKNDVTGGGSGIFQSVTNSNEVSENRVTNTGASAIVLFSANNGLIVSNTVAGATNGVSSSGSDGNRIQKNTFSGVLFDGINLRNGSDANLVDRNTLTGSGSIAIRVINGSHGNAIAQNVISGSGYGGIRIQFNSDNNTIDRNHISGNTSRGVEVLDAGSDSNVVSRNRVTGNGTGIQVFGADGTLVSQNTVTRNAFDGIIVNVGSTNTVVSQNDSHRNGLTPGPWDGIDVDAPGTTITKNSTNFNTQFGISAVPGVIDGGGNNAKHNGNPLECLNIPCG